MKVKKIIYTWYTFLELSLRIWYWLAAVIFSWKGVVLGILLFLTLWYQLDQYGCRRLGEETFREVKWTGVCYVETDKGWVPRKDMRGNW